MNEIQWWQIMGALILGEQTFTDLESESPAGLESEVRLEADIWAQSDTWFAICMKLQSDSVSNENLCMVINLRSGVLNRSQHGARGNFGNKSEMQICFLISQQGIRSVFGEAHLKLAWKRTSVSSCGLRKAEVTNKLEESALRWWAVNTPSASLAVHAHFTRQHASRCHVQREIRSPAHDF